MKTLKAFALCSCIVFFLFFKIILISGQSMSPALRDGQIVLIMKNVAYYGVDDMIVFTVKGDGNKIKRVIAVAGDTVLLKDGAIWRNGVRFSEYTCDPLANAEYILSENMLFVIGDNFNASIDSRNYGPVSTKAAIGKVILH